MSPRENDIIKKKLFFIQFFFYDWTNDKIVPICLGTRKRCDRHQSPSPSESTVHVQWRRLSPDVATLISFFFTYSRRNSHTQKFKISRPIQLTCLFQTVKTFKLSVTFSYITQSSIEIGLNYLKLIWNQILIEIIKHKMLATFFWKL